MGLLLWKQERTCWHQACECLPKPEFPAVTCYLVQGANTVPFQVFMISVMENYERFHISEDMAKNCNPVLGGVARLLAMTSSIRVTQQLTSGLAWNLGLSGEERGYCAPLRGLGS